MSLQGLKRVQLVHNKNYKCSGPKSYVYLLQKWGFEPTLPSPYFQMEKVDQTGKHSHLHKYGGKATTHRVLAKRKGHHHSHHGGASSSDPSSGLAPSGGASSGGAASGGATSGGASTTDAGEVTADDQQNDSEYLCPVQIGTPAQTLMLDFDTGSADLWCWSTELSASIQSQGKSANHTIYDPTKSSTCKKQSGLTWQISYGDSSSALGDVGTDVVSIGGLAI